ncbi:LysM peptidoglycan-binding domain-containing protein [Salipiger sp.]|uniref:LysM peptidoglycan-binding domain-containing protein n=1 Tax=Salipiger sp. TaxID=2078585 RepID=UPI003A98154C
MIRMVLLGLGFVAVTVALIVLQPGVRAPAPAELPDAAVTRADPAIAPLPDRGEDDRIRAIREAVRLPERAPAPAARPVSESAATNDEELRRMTWATLSNLNSATGRDRAPGQPGSLLHSIVQRSLDDETSRAAGIAPATPGDGAPVYVVKQGDSLVSIAEAIYGDVNMTGPLFAANQAILTRPDDLRPGQALTLPER